MRNAILFQDGGHVGFGDVVSEGDLIPGGMEIEVIERRGNRVVVRPVASA